MSSNFRSRLLAEELTAAFDRHGAKVHCETTDHGIQIASVDERVDTSNLYFASDRFEIDKSC